MQATQAHYVILAVALFVAVLVPRHTWWGQLVFWAAVFSFGLTAIYLWTTRRDKRR